ncbi:hypothetical protein HOLleu_20781 [Holothuria leucospilota]|uniref:Uncharacterized protein n=1 Tax=Holothuria leucospilota TaxID=206669 RepID=A0A9Q1C097_HOLLE|nr:hypothetical protein HOLleu_20781 [Holothuria leucospilota]
MNNQRTGNIHIYNHNINIHNSTKSSLASSVDTSGVRIGTLVRPSKSSSGDHPFRRLLVRHGTLGGVTSNV